MCRTLCMLFRSVIPRFRAFFLPFYSSGEHLNGAITDGNRHLLKCTSIAATVLIVSSLHLLAATPIRRVVAAGEQHCIILKNDGTLISFGDNSYGQLGDGGAVSESAVPGPVPGLTGVSAVAAGARHTLALKGDGTVWSWGSNGSGQLGDGSTVTRKVPVRVLNLTNIVAVAAGNYHNLALKSDGTLWAWGSNSSGRLGDGTMTQRNSPVRVTMSGRVIAVAAGYKHSLAETEDGKIWAWGANTNGQLGIGSTNQSLIPVQITALSALNVTDLAAGDSHSAAVTSAGVVYTWGNNDSGRLGIGNAAPQQLIPVSVPGLADILQIEVGVDFSIALGRDGSLYSWGNNALGQLADGTQDSIGIPEHIVRVQGVTALAAGFGQAIAVKSNGAVVTWGSNLSGQLGNGFFGETVSPTEVYGLNPSSPNRFVSVVAGDEHVMVLKGDGTVWAWGGNDYGQLGDGTHITRPAPQAVLGVSHATALAAGGHHSLALASDGTVWAWGSNGSGQLGDGTGTTPTGPVKVKNLTGVTALAAGEFHSLAIKSDGTLWAWGSNVGGRLGDGTTTQRNSPVRVGTLTGVVTIAAGTGHSLAMKSDGTIWAWGSNTNGQLGDGTTTQQKIPVRITSGLSGVQVISLTAGDTDSFAISSTGSVYAWGNNRSNRLGINSTDIQENLPTLISGLSHVVQIKAAIDHTIAYTTDDAVWAWGDNPYGQIGDGTQVQRNAPVQIANLRQIKGVAASGYFSAVFCDAIIVPENPKQPPVYDRVITWGYNPNGELGDGTTGTQTTPSQLDNEPLITVIDSDHDGLSDDRESNFGTSPTNSDSDGDTLLDGAEAATTVDTLFSGSFVFASAIDGDDRIHIKGAQVWD